jgi:RNA polymerase sigma factor (sigma-70 family)
MIAELRKYEALVKRRAAYWHRRTQHITGVIADEDDFFQIGFSGLLTIKKEFSYSLVSRVVDNKIIEALRSKGFYSRAEMKKYKLGVGTHRSIIELDAVVYSIEDPSPNQLEELIRKNIIETILKRLDKREQQILINFLKGYTLKEIANGLGITESRACQIMGDIVCKGEDVMAFKSEDSGKWKVFMLLASTPPAERISAEQIAADTKVSLGTVETYLKDFCRIVPEHVGYMGKPPLYALRADGKTVEEIYTRVKLYYNKKERDKRKKKDPPEQVDFVRGRLTSEPVFTPPTPEERIEETQPVVVGIPLTDLEKAKQLCLQILNPTVEFNFDQVLLFHNVIRNQQRHAKAILELLGCKPINE